MIPESEINKRAGLIADSLAYSLTLSGFNRGSVVAARKGKTEFPLAIRSLGNYGFGKDTMAFDDEQASLLHQAKLQVEYGSRVSGRNRQEQIEKIDASGRTISSWGMDLPLDMEPAHAFDPKSDLILSAAIKNPDQAAFLASSAVKAIKAVDDADLRLIQPKSSVFFDKCGSELAKLGLPDSRAGFVIIGSPFFKFDPALGYKRGPLILASQAFGTNASELTGFPIVAAKAGTVAITKKPSGPDKGRGYKGISHIRGGLPMNTIFGERVVAAGGLSNENDDVRAIENAVTHLEGILSISLLSELSR